MIKEKLKKIWDRISPFVFALAIVFVLYKFEHASQEVSAHLTDSVSIEQYKLENEGSRGTVFFESKGPEFYEHLNHFLSLHPNVEILSIIKEPSGAGVETKGYKVTFQ